jgi:hypothetical protein
LLKGTSTGDTCLHWKDPIRVPVPTPFGSLE